MRRLLHVIFSAIFFFFLLPAAGAQQAGAPVIKTSGLPAALTAQQGTASSSTNFEVSGTHLRAGILVTAPAGFEVGVDNRSFSNTTTIGRAGILAPTRVYLRLKASDIAGTYSGKVMLSSPGAGSVSLPVATSTILDAPARSKLQVNSAPPGPPADQTVANGGTVNGVDFGTTCTYNWFNDSPAIGLAQSGTGNIPSFTAVNTGTTPIIATITATPVETNYAYITNRTGNSVTIIDVATQSPVKTIPVGITPYAVAASADGSRVYVTSGDNKVYIIDTKTNTVEPQTISVGNGPAQLVLTADGNTLYVANSGSNTVSVVNTATYAVIATIVMQPNTQPTGIAISPDNSKVYVTEYGIDEVSVINTATNTVTATVQVGSNPYGVVVSPDGQTVYVGVFGAKTLSVINANTNTVESTLQFDIGPYGMALSPDGGTLYVNLTYEDVIQIVDAFSFTLGNRIQLPSGSYPLGIAFTKDGKKVYAVNSRAPLTVIDATTQLVSGSVDDGSAPVNGSSGSQGFGNFMSATSCNTVSFRITVNPESAPGIIATGTLAALTTTQGTASASTQFSVSGTSLTEGILVTPPPGFEVSLDNVNFSPTVTVGTGGNISPTPVYVRLGNTDAVGAYGGNNNDIVLTSAGAPNANEPTAVSTVTPETTPEITATGTLAALTTTQGTPSTSTQFSVAGANLTAGILVTPPPGFEVSLDNVNFSPTVIVGTGGDISPTPVYVRLGSTDLPGSYGGTNNNIVLSSPGATSVNEPTAVSTVNPLLATTPVITVAGTLSPLTTVYGTPSTSTTFTVSGANLTAKVTITAPPGFEVSTDDVTFGPTVNVTAGSTPVTVFVRLAATAPAGQYTPRNIILTSPGAADVGEATAGGTVNPAPLTITADNKGKIVGQDNPQLTVTYKGFVNGEQPADLTTLPVIITTATTASPIGNYPITVNGAVDPNYKFTYVAGVLTVSPVPPPISIPNAFTPNNDGINDTWNLKNIEKFPQSVVNIYDRYGQNVFSSIGYGTPWDGKYKGANLPVNVYYYIIDPKDGSPVISGNVTIIR